VEAREGGGKAGRPHEGFADASKRYERLDRQHFAERAMSAIDRDQSILAPNGLPQFEATPASFRPAAAARGVALPYMRRT
jgi:hypothetical protein